MRHFLITAVAVMVATAVAQGVVHYNNGGVWEISSQINKSVHIDEGPTYADTKTTVNIVEDCIIPGGSSPFNFLRAYNQSAVKVTGGRVDRLSAHDTSTVNISGGGLSWIWAYNSSMVDISDGWVNYVYAYDTSMVDISGGWVSHVCAFDTSMVNLSSGNIRSVLVDDNSTINFSGGGINKIYAQQQSMVTFLATEFFLGEGLLLDIDGQTLIGIGTLSGKWLDGTDWTTQIMANAETATILLIPEPATLLLLGLGGLTLRRARKS